MTIDHRPKPCLHKRANHQHGHYLTYRFDGCRCTPCETANRRHSKSTAYRTVTGTHSYVPADRVRAHVIELLEVLTVGQIEQRSGVHRTAIRVLVGDWPGKPPSRRITRKTERALLAVQSDRVGFERSGLVDGTGTRRRFRGLVALGWSAKHLGERLGFSSRTNWCMTSPDVSDARVRASTRDAVRKLYDELSLTVPPPSRARTRARNVAASRRWAPPLAWDDETIDDPAARPDRGTTLRMTEGTAFDEHAVDRAMAGDRVPLRPVERAEVVHRLTERGLSAAGIAARLGIAQRSVHRIRDEHRRTEGAA